MIDRYSRPAMKQVWSEEHKHRLWLDVELAVCEAWTEEGVIPEEDMTKLRGAQYDHSRMMEIQATVRHETNAFLTSVTEQLGPEGRWLHWGMTSSDKLDTAQALQLGEAGELLLTELRNAKNCVWGQAIKHKDTLMTGRTHGVHAEPITFGLKLALWGEEIARHEKRLKEAVQGIRVGKISGAVGTYATIPPIVEERVCKRLGLEVASVSNQIIQRDRYAHFMQTLALIASSLEKFATEIRSLQRTEIHELEEPFDEGQKGSSSMPHKRNPELSERICGLARLIRGYSVTALENVALWGERDISHSSNERVILPDACLALDYILDLFSHVVWNMRVYPERMRENLEMTNGLVFSQRVLLALVDKGMDRETAYRVVQKNSVVASDNNQDFRELLKSDMAVGQYLLTEELKELFDYGYYIRYVDVIFRRLKLLPPDTQGE